MKHKNKNILKISIISLITISALSSLNINNVNASDDFKFSDNNKSSNYKVIKDNNNSYQKQEIKKSYIVYGSGINDKTKKNIKESLDKNNILSDTQDLTVNGEDLYTILGIPDVDDKNVHSSISISPAKPGTGVLVNINNYDDKDNINMITPQQYALAAQLSGVNDAIITITSDKPVTGQGALAGLYLALQKDGINVNQTNIVAANEIINATTPSIVTNSKDNSYPGELTSAIANTAHFISTNKNSNTAEIKDELNKQLKVNDIINKTSDSNKEQIVTALSLISQTKFAKSNEFKKNTIKLSNNVEKSKGTTMAHLNNFKKATFKDNVQGIFSSVINFFSQLISKQSSVNTKKIPKAIKQQINNNGNDSSNNKLDNSSNNINYSNGTSNSSELLKLFNQWNGTKEDSIMQVNDGKATFTNNELNQQFKLKDNKPSELNPVNGLQLSQLDNLGRSQVANGLVTKESMSGTDARIPIPAASQPSGWYSNAKYNSDKHQWTGGIANNKKINNSYVYNKSHLIGWQFFDNNKSPNNVNGVMSTQNLVTGTRVQNADPGQLRYENQIAKDVKAGHSVRVQVTPIYSGTELVPRMTHYVAESVDDKGASLNVNAVILNVQPGANINYNTGQATKK